MPESTIGERFARALAAKDRAALLALLAPDVEFRGMTPSRFWDAHAATQVVDDILFGAWFEPTDHVESLDGVDVGTFGGLDKVTYRLRVRTGGELYEVEQQAYLEVVDDRITSMRAICSGYRRITDGADA